MLQHPAVLLTILVVIGLAIICSTLIKLAKITRDRDGTSRRAGRGAPQDDEEMDETELIQEIHRGLNRLEDRIEALETIVLSSENKKTSSPSHE